MTFDTWESYFYPPPDNATMRNIQGIRDPHVLHVFEYSVTALRQKQLNMDPSLVGEHTFDAAHLCRIHKYLFQDVYEWAGEYRTQNMVKQGAVRSFADVTNGEVDRYLADAQRLIQRTDWDRLSRDQFAVAAATVFAHVNQAHAFREGNGRSSKTFMEHIAMRSSFTLDYARIDPQAWNMASELSRPDIDRYNVVPDSLVPVFQHIAVERRASATPTIDPASRDRSLLSASYPQSPMQATQRSSSPASSQRFEAYRQGRGYDNSGQEIGR